LLRRAGGTTDNSFEDRRTSLLKVTGEELVAAIAAVPTIPASRQLLRQKREILIGFSSLTKIQV